MNNTQPTTERLHHIDGIKGLLCFLIMLGHFWNICRWSNPEAAFSNRVFSFINNSILGETIFSATFWMYAFLVISGYLLSGSKVRTFSELIIKSIKRYLRFALLIFGACVFIFILHKTVDFHTSETAAYFTNGWFQGYYPIDFELKSLVVEPIRALFFSGCAFNDPYWVMSDILVSSVIIYICNYMTRFTKKAPMVCLMIAILLDRHVIIACLAGYLMGLYREQLQKLTKNLLIFAITFVIIWGGFLTFKFNDILPTVFDEYFFYTLLYCCLLMIVDRFVVFQRAFSTTFFKILGKISFGVYSFHWPVICSIGSLALITGLKAGWNGELTYLLAFLFSIICTVIISLVYYFAIEKPTAKLMAIANRI